MRTGCVILLSALLHSDHVVHLVFNPSRVDSRVSTHPFALHSQTSMLSRDARDGLELDAVQKPPRQVDITAATLRYPSVHRCNSLQAGPYMADTVCSSSLLVLCGWPGHAASGVGGDGIRMGLAASSGGHDCLLDGTSSSGAVDRVPSSRTSESMDDTAVCTSKHLTGLVPIALLFCHQACICSPLLDASPRQGDCQPLFSHPLLLRTWYNDVGTQREHEGAIVCW